jgi:NAD-dependent DNA ligase
LGATLEAHVVKSTSLVIKGTSSARLTQSEKAKAMGIKVVETEELLDTYQREFCKIHIV